MVITEENLTMQEKDKNLLKLPTKYVKLAIHFVKIPDKQHFMSKSLIQDSELYPKKWTCILWYWLGDLNS